MTEDRFIRLETQLAYQEELLHQLNEVVVELMERIRMIEARAEQLGKKVTDLLELAAEDRGNSEKPPHY